jgi:hypothetical protein
MTDLTFFGFIAIQTSFLSSNAGRSSPSALKAPDCKFLPVASLSRTLPVGRAYGTAINEPTGSGGVFSIDLTSLGIQSYMEVMCSAGMLAELQPFLNVIKNRCDVIIARHSDKCIISCRRQSFVLKSPATPQ